jgi:hypothetical protein
MEGSYADQSENGAGKARGLNDCNGSIVLKKSVLPDCLRVQVQKNHGASTSIHPIAYANNGAHDLERHVRGKWVCDDCETLIQAPVPAHVIDKGIPTAGLLAHVMIAKFADHLPLYRQEKIFGRAGLPIARSTLAQWVGVCGVQLQPLVDARSHVDARRRPRRRTPVQMLTPGAKKTHRAYVWAYATSQFSDLAAVVYDFSPSRAGEHARAFLDNWNGKLVCDDFAGYVLQHIMTVTRPASISA